MKTIQLVGGGTAGWITAVYLDAVLNRKQKRGYTIRVLESDRIGRIGVGEATIPTLLETLQTMEIPEADFMKIASATFKHGILFQDWLRPNHSYFHPFDCQVSGYFDGAGADWLNSKGSTPFSELVTAQTRIAKANLAPRNEEMPEYRSPLGYAYHMDAEAFADYLAELGMSRGIQRDIDTVSEVELAEDGFIKAITTEKGNCLTADLFIDCTGFASVLAKAIGNTDFEDFSPWLYNDSAVAFRVPRTQSQEAIRPYTTTTAMSAGWRWDIGLQNRRGIGYVFSSNHISSDDAENELRSALGASVKDLEARHLKFRVGYRKQQWVKNCVSIGLSGGFIEPLESTGIALIEGAAKLLCEFFPHMGGHTPLSAEYNKMMSNQYNDLRDFIALHFYLSQRDDSQYWRDVRSPDALPASLRARLETWSFKAPSPLDFPNTFRIFSTRSWEYILYGMDWQPGQNSWLANGVKEKRVPHKDIRSAERHFKTILPPHNRYLKSLL